MPTRTPAHAASANTFATYAEDVPNSSTSAARNPGSRTSPPAATNASADATIRCFFDPSPGTHTCRDGPAPLPSSAAAKVAADDTSPSATSPTTPPDTAASRSPDREETSGRDPISGVPATIGPAGSSSGEVDAGTERNW